MARQRKDIQNVNSYSNHTQQFSTVKTVLVPEITPAKQELKLLG